VLPSLDWIVGFAEGEGTFVHCVGNAQSWKKHPIFAISQKEAQPLYLIAEALKAYGIHGKVYDYEESSGASKYVVSNVQGCRRVAELFHPLMHSERKKKQLEDWLMQIVLWEREGQTPLPNGQQRPWSLRSPQDAVEE